MSRLEEDVMPKKGYEVPILCIPPMRIEWHNYAMAANRLPINSFSKTDNMKFVSATNPFEVYNFLEKEKRGVGGKRLLISPLSTKLITLGVIMYLLDHPEDKSLTDSPVQIASNTIKAGKTHLYDLTYFVNSRRNQRFK